MSLTKNLKALTTVGPKAIVTWDKELRYVAEIRVLVGRYDWYIQAERIRRNEEIWSNSESIVHRLPEHFKKRYWDNLLRDAVPVHYRLPTSRFYWDSVKNMKVEAENYPIVGFRPPEADEGLWGGESIVKGWVESRPYTKKKVLPRQWVPRLFFPYLKKVVLYSEILDKYMEVIVTERACRLIDKHFGLDYYILETPEIDLASKLGNRLKREMLLTLANGSYHEGNDERRAYIKKKYTRFIIPSEEAEWIGLDLNEAARKQQDREDAYKPRPLKYSLEEELVQSLRSGSDVITNEEDYVRKTQESMFGEKLLGKYINPIAKKLQK